MNQEYNVSFSEVSGLNKSPLEDMVHQRFLQLYYAAL